jgi:adenylate cyclase
MNILTNPKPNDPTLHEAPYKAKMTKLPKDKITFFFTDIEGATRLAQQLGESYALILERHRAIIRRIIARYKGHEIDTAGDGFFIVFEKIDQAVSAAVDIQQAFTFESWATDIGLKVRIGIHSGIAQPTATGYTGIEVHKASRICNASYGSQVLLSEEASTMLFGALPQGVALIDLGRYLLKGFEQHERLLQLVIPGVKDDFPPPLTGTSEPRIAVLPFANLSAEPEQEYFCDGISEEIILAISNIYGLKVIARSSTFALKGKNLDAREIGKILNATVILEGSVRKKGNHLRISTQLVDCSTGLTLWSERFDSKIEDVFALQDSIAQSIAKALKIKLIPEQECCVQNRQTNNVAAYDFYLKGRQHYYQFSHKSIQAAIGMFREAIKIDKEYALAYCGLADSYAYLYMHGEKTKENLKNASQASKLAIQLGPLLAETYTSQGVVLTLKKQFKKAEACFEKAISINSYLFDAWYHYAKVCSFQGKFDKAARLYEEASRIRPEDYQAILLAGQIYDVMGIHELSKKARLQGIATVESILNINENDARALYLGANGLVALGEKEKGMEWLKRALEIDPSDPMLLYNAGCVYSLLNKKTKALELLEASVKAGLTQRNYYLNDSDLDNVRDLPRFKALLENLK